jgi:hypothetical protein
LAGKRFWNPIKYWKFNGHLWPRFVGMVFNMPETPAMSSGIERFSDAIELTTTVDKNLNHPHPETIGAYIIYASGAMGQVQCDPMKINNPGA